MTSLAGKVALVTGASRGIGAAVARALDAEGVKLGLASRSGDDLGISGAVARQVDVRDQAALNAFVADTAAAHGGPDILVVNAGVIVGLNNAATGPTMTPSPQMAMALPRSCGG